MAAMHLMSGLAVLVTALSLLVLALLLHRLI